MCARLNWDWFATDHIIEQAINYLLARPAPDTNTSADGNSPRSRAASITSPSVHDQSGGTLKAGRLARKYSTPTAGRRAGTAAAKMYTHASASEPKLNGKSTRARLSTGTFNPSQKRSDTPAAEYLARQEMGSPSSIRSYRQGDGLGDESMEVSSVSCLCGSVF